MLSWYNAELRVAARVAKSEGRSSRVPPKKAGQAPGRGRATPTGRSGSHFSRITLAKSEWDVNNVAGAVSLLEQCVPRSGHRDSRGLGMGATSCALTHAELLTLNDHENWVHSLRFGIDGTRLVAGTGLARGFNSTAHVTTPGSLHVLGHLDAPSDP